MATRAQKRAKRMRAKHHTNFYGADPVHPGGKPHGKRIKTDVGGRREDVRKDVGSDTLQRARMISFADRLGIPEPAEVARQTEILYDGVLRGQETDLLGVQQVMHRLGNGESLDTLRVQMNHPELEPVGFEMVELESSTPATSAPHTPEIHRDEVELRLEGDETQEGRRPTEAEWADMTALAKSKKKGVGKIAQREGWTIKKGDDPKVPESWTVWES